MSISDVMIGYLWVVLALQLLHLAKTIVRRKTKADPWRSNDFSEVKPWLVTLLRRGYAGGHVLIADDKPDRSFRFRKYIREKADYGLELCFSGADGAACWPQLQAYCEETGLRHRTAAEDSNGGPGDVLVIDCEQDVERAYDLALTIWTKMFHLSADNWYHRKIQDVSFHDELVDSPDHTNPWPEYDHDINHDFLKRFLREAVALSPGEAVRVMVFGMLAQISLIGLPIATLISTGDPPDWTLALGGVVLGGSTASLVFFLIFAFAFLMLRGFLDDKKKFKEAIKKKFKEDIANKDSPRARHFYPLHRFIHITLPIAVILIWAGV